MWHEGAGRAAGRGRVDRRDRPAQRAAVAQAGDGERLVDPPDRGRTGGRLQRNPAELSQALQCPLDRRRPVVPDRAGGWGNLRHRAAGIDLSVGAVLIFSGVIAGKVMLILHAGQSAIGAESAGWGVIVVGIVAGIGAGLAWGVLNGLL